jgi:hypothetical protein
MANNLKPGAIFVTFTKGLTSPMFEVLERKRYKMSWGPATVFIHRRLGFDGKPATPPFKLNLLPSDSVTYAEDENYADICGGNMSSDDEEEDDDGVIDEEDEVSHDEDEDEEDYYGDGRYDDDDISEDDDSAQEYTREWNQYQSKNNQMYQQPLRLQVNNPGSSEYSSTYVLLYTYFKKLHAMIPMIFCPL